jgi:hypothetical protein
MGKRVSSGLLVSGTLAGLAHAIVAEQPRCRKYETAFQQAAAKAGRARCTPPQRRENMAKTAIEFRFFPPFKVHDLGSSRQI